MCFRCFKKGLCLLKIITFQFATLKANPVRPYLPSFGTEFSAIKSIIRKGPIFGIPSNHLSDKKWIYQKNHLFLEWTLIWKDTFGLMHIMTWQVLFES